MERKYEVMHHSAIGKETQPVTHPSEPCLERLKRIQVFQNSPIEHGMKEEILMAPAHL